MKALILASLLILPTLSIAGDKGQKKCDPKVIKCAYGINPGTGCCKPHPKNSNGNNGNNGNSGSNGANSCDTTTMKCENGIDYETCSCIIK